MWQLLKRLNIVTVWPQILHQGTHLREMKTSVHTQTCTQMFTEALLMTDKSGYNPHIHQLTNGNWRWCTQWSRSDNKKEWHAEGSTDCATKQTTFTTSCGVKGQSQRSPPFTGKGCNRLVLELGALERNRGGRQSFFLGWWRRAKTTCDNYIV